MGVTEKAVLYSRSRFSWELSEIRAAKPDGARLLREAPAAFGRLCVETSVINILTIELVPAAFGRLCVETATREKDTAQFHNQPPSGGCVLKLCLSYIAEMKLRPAAFGRLCVETVSLP